MVTIRLLTVNTGEPMLGFFERLVDPFPIESPTQPPAGLLAFCRHYARGYERYLLLMAVLTAAGAVGEAFLFGVLGQIVDWLAASDPEHFIDDHWPKLLGMSLFVLVFLPLVTALHSLMVNQTLMGNFPMSVRWMAHRYLLNQSYAFFQNEFSGRVATKLMQTALAVRESVMKCLDVMLFASVYLGTMLLIVASGDMRLMIPGLCWLLAYIGVLRFFIPRLRGVSERQADARSLMTGRIVDSYTNVMTLKLFSHSQREAHYAREGMSEFIQTVYPQMRLVTGLNISVWAINMLLVFSTCATAITLWMHGAVTPGPVAVAIGMAIRLTGMSHWIMWEMTALFENIGVVQDGINTLALPHAVVDKPDAGPLTVSSGAIEFDRIQFAYNEVRPVFAGLDLRIAAGEKVGVVGRSGAGKSTLVNLLLRFYDLQGGSIRVDGQDISDVEQDSLRAHIAVVTQDTSLLHRSVRENIMFGRPDASEEELIRATKRAKADEFIEALCDIRGRCGLNAHVGERGVNLSGGQRQRIAIARVLLKDAPILVLDEATSALDSEVEASIQQSLNELMQGKTVIAIAHRLSTIAAMDRLIVLDNGQIVEEGTHTALVNRGGLYSQLWAHQSGGFLGQE